ncbi:hypothetical protein K438DRAFT_1761848 [Mycena galopus ATCC 62051]|nr:hypothetical protein K438DRAFT_1761848 [Mycena galopus ATCC 62051]
MAKLWAQIPPLMSVFSYVCAFSIDVRQQLQRMGSQTQYVGSEVERVRSEVCEMGSLIMVTMGKQISDAESNMQRLVQDAESNIMQRLIQGLDLHHVSVAMFSVTDPLGRPIPISLTHCGDFEACMFNQPEAGARYVEWGDYNLFLPGGMLVRHVNFAQSVKPGMEFDMSIIKQQRFKYKPDLEECPYCGEENPRPAENEWIQW